jgi:hypothetical protein
MQFVNLTPHGVTIARKNGSTFTVAPSGTVARREERRVECDPLDWGIAIGVAEYGDVTGLPAPVPGVAYIVSGLVLSAVPHRHDVFAPGPAVRDDQGRVIGCRGLSGTPTYATRKVVCVRHVTGYIGGHAEGILPDDEARCKEDVQRAVEEMSRECDIVEVIPGGAFDSGDEVGWTELVIGYKKLSTPEGR